MGKDSKKLVISSVDRKAMELGASDFRLWCNHFINWDPKPYQEYFVTHPSRDKLWVAGIRSGKSSGIAAGLLWNAFYKPGARVANGAAILDQSSIVFRECANHCQGTKLERYVEDIQRAFNGYPRILMANNSELWFRPIGLEAEYWRGWEFDIISVDEAAYVRREDAIKTLRGRLVGVGRLGYLWLISTPKGRGWLYERWLKGDPATSQYAGLDRRGYPRYLSMRTRTSDNDSLTSEQIEDLREDYTQRLVQQELEGVFLADEDAVFPYDDIMACHSEEMDFLVKQALNYDYYDTKLTKYYLPPQPGHTYIAGWDIGKGMKKRMGRGASVGVCLDTTSVPWKLVAFHHITGKGYAASYPAIRDMKNLYGAELIMDATGVGDLVDEQLERDFDTEVDVPFIFGATSKPQVIHNLQYVLENRLIEYPMLELLMNQLRNYEYEDRLIAQDTVMALAQACKLARDYLPQDAITRRVADSRRIYDILNSENSATNRFIKRRVATRQGRTRTRRSIRA